MMSEAVALTVEDLEQIYTKFLTKGISELKTLQLETQMEDEFLATASSNVIVGAMENSINALQTIKASQLIDKQIITEVNKATDLASATTVRNAQHAKDMLIKDQQEIGERIKNGGLYYTYTYDVNGSVLTKTLENGTTKSIHEHQMDKMIADTAFSKAQKLQLEYSVTYNNRIKVMEDYGTMLGNLGLGGLNVSAGMWTTYFNMANDIYINHGEVPVLKNISVPAAEALVLTKIV